MRFNTFNEVVRRYEHTKPVVSKHHTAEDNIRPIGDRKRKWERIRKVDAETYLLLDREYGNAQYEQDMAPIMWKREADGDYIYIRNGIVNSISFSRFKFLIGICRDVWRSATTNRASTGYVLRHPQGSRISPLPKTAYVWNYTQGELISDDGKRLKFRANEDGTFTRAGDAFTVTVTAVDRGLKKQWKAKIDAFYTQAAVLAPMLDATWQGRNLYRKTIAEWCVDNGVVIPPYNLSTAIVTPELARIIVEQDDHPMRVPLMALVIGAINGKREVNSKDDLTKIKSAYNRLMNKALGMYGTKEV